MIDGLENSNDGLIATCISSIRNFVNAIRPSRYSTVGTVGGELLEAELKLNESWGDFEALSQHGWSILREQISRTEGIYLWYYAVRMAEMAVRKNDEHFIRFGMLALIVDDTFTEDRDLYTALALLLDAAKRIEAHAISLFKKTAKLGSMKRCEAIERFIDERGGEASMGHVLTGLGYAAFGSGETFCYRSTV